jgi:NADPH2:quinone reductase
LFRNKNNQMKAITIVGKGQVALSEVPQPEKAGAGHLIIKMQSMGINAGDKFFIGGNFPPGMFTQSQYDIAGVSGVGKVTGIGDGVPENYLGKNVTIYRSLTTGEDIVGTWSEHAHLPYLQCAILPDDVDPDEYAGVLVNLITAYGAYKQAIKEGHQGIVVTAGNSDTGKAMLGFGLSAGFPVISIVRNDAGLQELKKLGAQHVLVQGTPQFQQQYVALSADLKATAVFDGVGGALLGDLLELALPGTSIYAYGFLGGGTPVSFHTGILVKGITIKGFSNFKTETVQDPQQLAEALEEISKVIHLPHFKFKIGKRFSFEDIQQALAYVASTDGKALLTIQG